MISKLSNNIKIISNFGAGFSNIDINAAKKRNIVVTNTPDVLTEATAEIAILIILGAARRATEGIKYARNKNWRWSSDFLIGKELNQANLGILGMGRIGRAVARRARSFGMKIHYCNRVRLPPDLENESIYHDNIKSLFSVSDFLSINCSSTKETKHIINKKTLNYFPEGAVIANSARGEIIEDDAMIDALKNGKIFSLGLDVYNGEPNIHPEYLTLPNVFVLPHLGSSTMKTRTEMANLAIKNIEDFLSSFRKNLVNVGFNLFDPIDGLKIPQQLEQSINLSNRSYLTTVIGLAFRKLDVFGYYKFVTAVKNINLLPSRQGMIKQKKMKAFSNFAYKGAVGAIVAIYIILFTLSFWNIHSYNQKLVKYDNVVLNHSNITEEKNAVTKKLKVITTTLKLSSTLKSNKDLSYRILAQVASSVPKRVRSLEMSCCGKCPNDDGRHGHYSKEHGDQIFPDNH